jgi:hypothetical protein
VLYLENVQVVLYDFKNSVPGTVTPNSDGTYTIFINSRLSREMQEEVYLHELRHIKNGDFDKFNVNMIECMAHAY